MIRLDPETDQIIMDDAKKNYEGNYSMAARNAILRYYGQANKIEILKKGVDIVNA